MAPMKLYAHPDKCATKKMLIAANYAELEVEIPKNVGTDDVGRIPVLETDKGCIFHTGAVLRYLGRLRRDVPLYGQNLLEAGMIDSWSEFSVHELEVPLNLWVNHATGANAVPAEVVERAKGDTQKALTVLNNHLLHYTFMVTDGVTLADISLCCALAEGFTSVLSAELKGSLTNLVRWFNLCMAQPEVQKVMGKVGKVAAAAPAAGKGKTSPKAAPAKAEPKKDAKKDASPKNAAKAAPKQAAAPAGGAVDEATIKAIGDEIRVLKDKLKEQGITGKKLNDHPEVTALVGKLAAAKTGGGAAAPAAAKKAAAPAAAGGGEEAIKAVGDQVRVLKEKLKAEGITGKKLNDHAEVAALVAKLSEMKAGAPAASASPKAAPKAAPKEAAAKKGGNKEKGGDAAEKVLSPEEAKKAAEKKKKAVIKEGGKKGVEIEGASDMGGLQFFCTSVIEPDGDLELVEECMAAMNAKSDPADEERKGGSGAIGKMIFSAGTDCLAVCAYVPEAKHGELSCEAWLKKVLALFSGEVTKTSKTVCLGKVKADGNKNIFPLKIREPMILEANNFLRKLGLFPEDNGSDSDEMVFGDDDFPS